jgi:hypothetical protein
MALTFCKLYITFILFVLIGLSPHLPCKYTNPTSGNHISPYILSSTFKDLLKKRIYICGFFHPLSYRVFMDISIYNRWCRGVFESLITLNLFLRGTTPDGRRRIVGITYSLCVRRTAANRLDVVIVRGMMYYIITVYRGTHPIRGRYLQRS